MTSKHDPLTGAKWLSNAVEEALRVGKGLAVGKLGTCELETLHSYHRNIPMNFFTRRAIQRNGGIWPETESWATHMLRDVIPEMDGFVEWNSPVIEDEILRLSPYSTRIALRSLEPYYHPPEARWTLRIPEDTKVAIVTSFAGSIQQQLPCINQLFPTPMWRSGIDFQLVRSGCSPAIDSVGPAAWPPEILKQSWKAAVSSIVDQVLASNARVAIVGCGALSLAVIVELKKHGVVAIHLGGATQILFGVKGKRWQTHDVIRTFFNDHWISPLPEEVPAGFLQVEGGCYW
jgi:hypothetical protein